LREEFNGAGNVVTAWSQDYNFLALCGENNVLHVINRQGKKTFEANMQKPGKVEAIDWDIEGDTLAIQQAGLNLVTLWNLLTKTYTEIVNTQTTKDRVTFIRWSRTKPVLVFGTEKGLLTFYYKKKLNSLPCVGKHSKEVISGDWNDDLLVTGGKDNMITISKVNGDTARQSLILKGPPQDLCWARQKTDDRDSELKHVTAIVKGKVITLADITCNKMNEINFHPGYGQITVSWILTLVLSMVWRWLYDSRFC